MQEIILLALVMALAMGAYWSMVIFPKQRDFQKRQRFVQNLAEGDEVITAGGIIGRVVGVEAEQGIAYVEIAEGVVVRMISASLLSAFDPAELAKNAQMGLLEERQEAN
jgi:preprotein translocase subunit YajC